VRFCVIFRVQALSLKKTMSPKTLLGAQGTQLRAWPSQLPMKSLHKRSFVKIKLHALDCRGQRKSGL
jgi:hypothetical protein